MTDRFQLTSLPTKTMHNQKIGQIGEKYAADLLNSTGHTIIARNFHSRYGEIDIIAQDNNTHKGLFVEVKTRINLNYGLPEEAITYHKFSKILKTISHFFTTVKPHPFNSWRIDVIAVILSKNKELISIEHYRNIQVF